MLRIVEVCWYGDDSVFNVFIEVSFCDFFYFDEYYGRNFFRGKFFFFVVKFDDDYRFVRFVGFDFE